MKKLLAALLLLLSAAGSLQVGAADRSGAGVFAGRAVGAHLQVLDTGGLPAPGEILTAQQLLLLAREDGGQPDIVSRLEQELPAKRFVSDGCSGGCPNVWRGVSIYQACFWHDARYYLGGSLVDKLQADARLMLDVCALTGDPYWAVAMFNGVWLGGDLPASWRWGKVGVP